MFNVCDLKWAGKIIQFAACILGLFFTFCALGQAAAPLCEDKINCFSPLACCGNGYCQLDCKVDPGPAPNSAPVGGCASRGGSGAWGDECYTCNPTNKSDCAKGKWNCFYCDAVLTPLPSTAASCSRLGGVCGGAFSCCSDLSCLDFKCRPGGCGNGTCDPGEDCANCPQDCKNPDYPPQPVSCPVGCTIGVCVINNAVCPTGSSGTCFANGHVCTDSGFWNQKLNACCCPGTPPPPPPSTKSLSSPSRPADTRSGPHYTIGAGSPATSYVPITTKKGQQGLKDSLSSSTEDLKKLQEGQGLSHEVIPVSVDQTR